MRGFSGCSQMERGLIFSGFRGIELGSKPRLTEMEYLHGRCGHRWITKRAN